MPKIFDREDEPNDFMEMPCRCDCGKWFDLNDGYTSERDQNKVICGACGEVEQKEIEREEDIASWKDALVNAEEDVKSCKAELKKLGIETEPPTPASLEDEAKALYPDSKENFDIKIAINDLHEHERLAHITCARMYVDTIERLKGALTKIEGLARRFGNRGSDPEKDIELIEKLATEALKTTQ